MKPGVRNAILHDRTLSEALEVVRSSGLTDIEGLQEAAAVLRAENEAS